MTELLAAIPLAFLAGSVPFGLLIGRAKGVDIRTIGSGNIGATNLGRALGKKYFLLCFALDFLKGFVPTLIAGWAAGLLGNPASSPRESWLWLAVMLSPVLGHVFNPWLKFKGGKGVATSLGLLMAVWPQLTIPGVAAFLIWGACLAATRYMSLASMVAAASLPLVVLVEFMFWSKQTPPRARLEDGLPFLLVAALLAILVVWTHRANIRRLREGRELRLGRKAIQQK